MPAIYEKQLADDLQWALQEGSLHFEQKSAVQQTLRKIALELDRLSVDYAIAGGMALFSHGFRRFTEDVDILVTRDGLKVIHASLDGRGYVPPFRGSKNLRDAEYGVRIEFLIAGEYPGDGRPKPVAFPVPREAATERDGVRFLNLSSLIELKLASGMSSADRIKDLADVQELVKLFQLRSDFENNLNLYVRDKYRELWQAAVGSRKRYALILQTPPLPASVQTLEDLIAYLPQEAAWLDAMRQDGVTLDREHSRLARGYVVLATLDPAVAERCDFHDEADILFED